MGNIDEGAEVLMGHTVQQVHYYTPCTASRPRYKYFFRSRRSPVQASGGTGALHFSDQMITTTFSLVQPPYLRLLLSHNKLTTIIIVIFALSGSFLGDSSLWRAGTNAYLCIPRFGVEGSLFSGEKCIQGAVSTSAIITYNQKALICRRGEVNWTTKETLVQQRPGNLTGGSKVGLLRSLPARGVFIYWSASSLRLNLLNSFDYVLKMVHMKQTSVYTICAHLAEQRKHFCTCRKKTSKEREIRKANRAKTSRGK